MHSLFLFFNFSILLVFDRFCLEGHQHNVSGNQQRQLVIAPSILSRFKSLLSTIPPPEKASPVSSTDLYTHFFRRHQSFAYQFSPTLVSSLAARGFWSIRGRSAGFHCTPPVVLGSCRWQGNCSAELANKSPVSARQEG